MPAGLFARRSKLLSMKRVVVFGVVRRAERVMTLRKTANGRLARPAKRLYTFGARGTESSPMVQPTSQMSASTC